MTNKIIMYYFINKKNTNILLPIARGGGDAKGNCQGNALFIKGSYCSLGGLNSVLTGGRALTLELLL